MNYKNTAIAIVVLAAMICSCDKNDGKLPSSPGVDSEIPKVLIISPANNAVFGEGEIVTIQADMTDNNNVADVHFYIDGEMIGSDADKPYIYEWDTQGKVGYHTIKVKAYDTSSKTGESDELSIKVNPSPNSNPIATFDVNPSSGTIYTTFNFNASGSNDKETLFSNLRFNWDWENNGIWEISNSDNFNPSHHFNKTGVYPVRCMVTDDGKLWDDTIRAVGVYEMGTVSDNEGIVYKTVKIGNQWWMAENLKSTRFRNGDLITEQWAYDDDENNVAAYGRLYSWNAINDYRQLTPYGWHIPSDEEVQILIEYLGGLDIAGDKIKSTDTTLWKQLLTVPNNESGFSAEPAGSRNARTEPYYDWKGYIATWWTSTDIDEIYNGVYGVNHFSSKFTSGKGFKYFNHSVRCIKD
jgi:uncharacterized protein (TIGR02145 family)